MARCSQESDHDVKSSREIEQKPLVPLSADANKLEQSVRKCYLEKIAAIGIDPVLIGGKNFEPDCLPPVESTFFWRPVIT